MLMRWRWRAQHKNSCGDAALSARPHGLRRRLAQELHKHNKRHAIPKQTNTRVYYSHAHRSKHFGTDGRRLIAVCKTTLTERTDSFFFFFFSVSLAVGSLLLLMGGPMASAASVVECDAVSRFPKGRKKLKDLAAASPTPTGRAFSTLEANSIWKRYHRRRGNSNRTALNTQVTCSRSERFAQTGLR